MRVLALLAVLSLACAQAQSVNAVFSFGGTVQEVAQCCSQNPTWFSLWETFAPNSTADAALQSINALSVSSWQQQVTPQLEPAAFAAFKAAAWVGKGPNLLLASTQGLLDLALCGALRPWTLDADLTAALSPQVLSLVTWNGARWGLPIAQQTPVIFYNRALVNGSVPTDLAAFVALASSCSQRMVLSLELSDLNGFFAGTTLFPNSTSCSATAGIQAVFAQLHTLAVAPCVTTSTAAAPSRDFERGLAAFRNGLSSDLGRYEAALGANLGIARFPTLDAQIDTRGTLSATVLYANAANTRQAAVDWSNFAASRGQARTWQNTGRLTSVRAGVTLPAVAWMQQNTLALVAATGAAWPEPNTAFWFGLQGHAGFVRAFTPVAALLPSLNATSAAVMAATVGACTCMNTGVC